MKIDILKIAKLSNLSLKKEELSRLERQLDETVKYIDSTFQQLDARYAQLTHGTHLKTQQPSQPVVSQAEVSTSPVVPQSPAQVPEEEAQPVLPDAEEQQIEKDESEEEK